MKFFQKRAVAAVVLILAIVAGVVIGQAKKPDTGGQASTAIVGSYTYVYDYAGVLTDETMEHIDAMNASLFAQTGAQILVDVVNSTGGADIMEYATDLGNTYGVGSAERNNGVVMAAGPGQRLPKRPDGRLLRGGGDRAGEPRGRFHESAVLLPGE